MSVWVCGRLYFKMSKPSQKLVSIAKSICAQYMIGYSSECVCVGVYYIRRILSVFVFGCRYFYFSLNWLDFGIGKLCYTIVRSLKSLNLRTKSHQMLSKFQFVLGKVQNIWLFSFFKSVGKSRKLQISLVFALWQSTPQVDLCILQVCCVFCLKHTWTYESIDYLLFYLYLRIASLA